NAEEARRRNTDDGQQCLVDSNLTPHNIHVSAESAVPVFVADHSARLRISGIIVCFGQHAAGDGSDSEDGEEIAGYTLLLDRLRLWPWRGYQEPRSTNVGSCDDAAERLTSIPVHFVKRIVGVVAEARRGVGAGDFEQHQFL